jgi:hypothetical protein
LTTTALEVESDIEAASELFRLFGTTEDVKPELSAGTTAKLNALGGKADVESMGGATEEVVVPAFEFMAGGSIGNVEASFEGNCAGWTADPMATAVLGVIGVDEFEIEEPCAN